MSKYEITSGAIHHDPLTENTRQILLAAANVSSLPKKLMTGLVPDEDASSYAAANH